MYKEPDLYHSFRTVRHQRLWN